jgi:hypothetical protein
MNADEIVKGLTTEILCENCPHNILHESECFTKGCYFVNAATLIESLQAQLAASQRRAQDARNELCLKCGRYREAHKGACDGCRWKE